MLAEIAQHHLGPEQLSGRPREHDLASVRRGDSGRAVDVDADVSLLRNERLPGVDPDPNTNRPAAQAVTDLLGSGHRSGSPRERGEERVALRVHLDPRMPAQSATYHLPMCTEKVRVRVAVLMKELRRALDIGEEECDGAAWKILSHT